jgi:hypothetical protein
MLREIDGHYVAAEIRFLRQVSKGTILVVEGQNDAKVFKRFIDTVSCELEIAFGKRNVCEALDLLEDEGFPGVVGVIDSDFDRLTGTSWGLKNLCVTDVHDLDLMIFLSPALERYLEEYGDVARIKERFEGVAAVRMTIIGTCLPIACCRLASERRKLRLRFSGLKHEELVCEETLVMDRDALIAAVVARSGSRCTQVTLTQYMAAEMSRNHDPHQLTSGHDAAAVLGIALRKILGDRRDVHTWATEVEAGLRLAFDWNALTGTGLYGCPQAWERDNAPYRIFEH